MGLRTVNRKRPLRIASVIAGIVLGLTTACGQNPEPAIDRGFQNLFNGKDLGGWDGDPRFWSIRDGAITGQIVSRTNLPARNTFLIWTNGTVADFELRLSYRTLTNVSNLRANSGIQYRSRVIDATNWAVGGYQADFETGTNYNGILYDNYGVAGNRRIMARCGEKVLWTRDCKREITGAVGSTDEIQAAITNGVWNEYMIIARSNHLQHFINGKQTVDVTDDCEAHRLASGVLALELHVRFLMTVQFKDIRLKTLQ